MAEIVAAAAAAAAAAAGAAAYSPCRNLFPLVLRGGRSTIPPNAITMRWGKKNYKNNAMRNTSHSMILPAAAAVGGMIGSEENKQPPPDIVTFSSNISTELPLYERPGVSFDEYLLDRPRIFNAIFPDRCRSTRLNDEEWRVQMLPLQFLLLTVNPVVDMRLRSKSQGNECPSSVSRNITTSVLELQATRWELQGLDSTYVPSYFALSVQGMLYPDQNGGRRCLKGELEMSFSFVLPPVLALVPENVLRGVAESLLKRLVEKMKRDVDARLTEDFWRFQREKLIEHERAKRFRDSCNGSKDRRGPFLL